MKFCAGDPFGGQFRKYIRAAAMWQLLQVTLPDFLEQAATTVILPKHRILCALDLVLIDELQSKPFFSLAVDSKYCIKYKQAKF